MKKNNLSKTSDISDAGKDQAKLRPETTVIDMPEVKDIPGQENIRPPKLRAMEDLTISSSDEEADGILDDLNTEEEDVLTAGISNVTTQEKKLLEKSAGHPPTADTADFKKMVLDDTDEDGDALNEKGLKQSSNGEDLDLPGTELDDADEKTGAEDEENNIYSQRD
jgi:hypothetical protein